MRTPLKRTYYCKSVSHNRRYHRQLWNVLKELNPSKKSNPEKITGLKIDSVLENDIANIVNHLNEYFASIGSHVSTNSSASNPDVSCTKERFSATPSHSFKFSEISEDFVLNELQNLQTNKATGLDTISAQLLKVAAPAIYKQLTYLFNLTLKTGKIPSDWKEAKVSPIYKGGDRTDKNNYRPISVISVVMKILERAVHDQLQTYLMEHNMLSAQQSGFRKGHSTDTVLTFFYDYLLKQMDVGNLTGVVFLDFRKAFDSVNHELLLQKLQTFGVQGIELAWFKDYLDKRKQKTVIGEAESNWSTILSGVPQGSILGPLLFTIMVNDLPNSVSICQIMLYADDAELFYSSPKPEDIERTLNLELVNVHEWVKANKLALNLLKTQYMIFGSSNKLSNIRNPICLAIDEHQLSQVDSFKYLGVWLDPTLNWKEHVKNTSKKIGARIARLGRTKKYLPCSSLKLLANSLVMPLFEYCCNAWSNCSQNVKDTLIKQHKKMARVILGADVRTPTQNLFKRLHWVNIEEL